MKQKVMRVGNSLGVTVPADFVQEMGVKAGDPVEVKKGIKSGEIIYKFFGIQQLPITASFLQKRKKRKK